VGDREPVRSRAPPSGSPRGSLRRDPARQRTTPCESGASVETGAIRTDRARTQRSGWQIPCCTPFVVRDSSERPGPTRPGRNHLGIRVLGSRRKVRIPACTSGHSRMRPLEFGDAMKRLIHSGGTQCGCRTEPACNVRPDSCPPDREMLAATDRTAPSPPAATGSTGPRNVLPVTVRTGRHASEARSRSCRRRVPLTLTQVASSSSRFGTCASAALPHNGSPATPRRAPFPSDDSALPARIEVTAMDVAPLGDEPIPDSVRIGGAGRNRPTR